MKPDFTVAKSEMTDVYSDTLKVRGQYSSIKALTKCYSVTVSAMKSGVKAFYTPVKILSYISS